MRSERYHIARRDPDLVVIEGFHALKHALRFSAEIIDAAVSNRAEIEELAAAVAPDLIPLLARLALHELPPAEIASLSPSPHPTGVIAIARRPRPDIERIVCDVGDAPVIVLDDPRHAGNIGASIRVAAAASAAALLVTGPSDPWQPAAVRGAAGLQFALPVAHIGALPATSRLVVGVDPEGADLFDGDTAPLPHDAILVFGSERSGITASMRERISRMVRIPMRDGVSSLNLATAVAVMLYHGGRRGA
jgi:TrmH family RNA methyltransferase